MSIVTRFFPNGEFSYGVDSSRRRKERAKKEKHEPLAQECKDSYLQWRSQNADMNLCALGQSYLDREGEKLWVYTGVDERGNHTYDVINSEGADTLGVQMNYPIGRLVGDGSLIPLVHQTVESSAQRKTKGRKQCERMTRNMARNIRNAGYLLQAKYGKDNITFATFTLPNLSTDDLATISARWDELVDNFLHSIRKRVTKHTKHFEYVYCTEIQPKRLEKRHEYAPHLHLAMRGRNGKKKPWYVSPKQFRSAWGNAIAHILGHNDFDRRALENVQRVKRSVSGYLSKYMSKGSNCNPEKSDDENTPKLITQWGGMARVLSREIKASTRRFTTAGDDRPFTLSFVTKLGELLEVGLLSYYREGFIVLSVCPSTGMERGIKVGCGCLSTPSSEGGIDRIREYLLGDKSRKVTKCEHPLDKLRLN